MTARSPCSKGPLAKHGQRRFAHVRGAREPSAVDMERRKTLGTDPGLYTRQVGDASMYSIDDKHRVVKDADPEEHIGAPPIARHVFDEAVDSQVISTVLGCVERLAALSIYR